MLEVLLESHHVRPPRPVAATVLSAAAHAAVVIGLLGGVKVATRTEGIPQIWEQLARRFLAPPQAPPSVAGERIAFVAIHASGSPTGVKMPDAVPVKVTDNALADLVMPRLEPMTAHVDPTQLLARIAKTLGAYTLIELDSVAERDPRSAAPEYPPDMLKQNVEGFATFRFVIDSTGRVDLTTVKLVGASNTEFVKAVRVAMPDMRFRPAMRAAQYVRQLVEQPFRFQIAAPPVPVAPAVRKPGQSE